MISLLEKTVNITTSSPVLQDWIMGHADISFLPQHQYHVVDMNGQRMYVFSNIPCKIISQIGHLESTGKLEDAEYFISDSASRRAIMFKFQGNLVKYNSRE